MNNQQHETTVIIEGHSATTKDSTLRRYFQRFGTNKIVRSVTDASGEMKKTVLSFQNLKGVDLKRLLNTKHNLKGQDVNITLLEKSQPEEKQVPPKQSQTHNESHKIFVGGLHVNVDTTALSKYFRKFGEIQEAKVVLHNDTQKSRGFGFVVFKNRDSVKAVLAKHKEHKIHGKWVDSYSNA